MKINLFEALLIIIAIMWLFGYFRRLIPKENQGREERKSPPEPRIRRKQYGDEGEFVDYEEIK